MSYEPLILSFQIASIALVITGVLGIAVAAVLANGRFVGRDLLDVVFTSPAVLPPTVLGYYLLVLVDRRSAFGQVFEAVTGSSIVFTKTGAVVAAVIGTMPLVVRNARSALEDIVPSSSRQQGPSAPPRGARPSPCRSRSRRGGSPPRSCSPSRAHSGTSG